MAGRVASGQLCTVEPLREGDPLRVGDIVLCRVRGSEYLHLVHAIRAERYLIGNNRGGLNGWIGRPAIFGRCISVE